MSDKGPDSESISLKQFCRAMAAHLLLSSHPDVLHSVLAPETAERTADYIHRFALGESLARPRIKIEEET